ncbi:hypothetical protein [Paenisporosarcina sp. OV554]|uniref:hypothetical protein n=1 Tax=Paenisporosarcina sp. OV554 TaxID=2135694 RepID=UPI001304B346|nr:hypothetical protein [Paenisporosarcina sp. OV554]
MLNLNLAAHRFREGLRFCGKKIDWELGGNWIVATITEEVATKRPRVESITREVAPIRPIVETILREVATKRTRVATIPREVTPIP